MKRGSNPTLVVWISLFRSHNNQIPIETFVNLAHATGPGKYILGQRGKGIRGFNKITDCMVEPEEAVIIENTYTTFAAEDSISVKRNLRLSDMSDRAKLVI